MISQKIEIREKERSTLCDRSETGVEAAPVTSHRRIRLPEVYFGGNCVVSVPVCLDINGVICYWNSISNLVNR